MRTKTLLGLVAMAIAIPASAQVYSANVVGYYNVPVPGGLTAMAINLKAGANRADQVIPYTAGDSIQVWSGVSWDMFVMDPGQPSQWANANEEEVPVENLPVLSLGKGFFYGKNSAVTALTIVGEVISGTNSVAIPSGLTAAGSQLPVGGDPSAVGTAAVSAVNLPLQAGSSLQFWNGVGWDMVIRDPGFTSGWSNANEEEIPAPDLAVGQGFFIGNNGAPFNWEQWYNPQP